MSISLPDSLKEFVDEQVQRRGYETSSECIRELIRRDHDRSKLRDLLLEGASAPPTKGLRRMTDCNLRGSPP
jgi:antitoxin ParD1/3/4